MTTTAVADADGSTPTPTPVSTDVAVSVVMTAPPENLSKSLNKAVAALMDYAQRPKTADTPQKKKALFEESDEKGAGSTAFYVMFGLKKVPEWVSIKPQCLRVSHAWKTASSEESLQVCLITKDPHDEYKKKVREMGLKAVTKVMSVSKLRKNYVPYEARRKLCAAYDVFLADNRVLPLLPKLLGKKFFGAKKTPIVVDLVKEDMKTELTTAIESTYLHLTTGPCSTVKIGQSHQGTTMLVENGLDVIKQVVERIPHGWDNINSIHVKSFDSLALPVYTSKTGKTQSAPSLDTQQ